MRPLLRVLREDPRVPRRSCDGGLPATPPSTSICSTISCSGSAAEASSSSLGQLRLVAYALTRPSNSTSSKLTSTGRSSPTTGRSFEWVSELGGRTIRGGKGSRLGVRPCHNRPPPRGRLAKGWTGSGELWVQLAGPLQKERDRLFYRRQASKGHGTGAWQSPSPALSYASPSTAVASVGAACSRPRTSIGSSSWICSTYLRTPSRA